MKWAVYGLICQGMLAYFFFKSWTAMVVLTPISIFMVYRQWRGWRKYILLELEIGFKEWLSYVKGGLGAGKSIEQAIQSCKQSFQNHIGGNHPVLPGLEQIYRSMELRIPLEECLQRFGQETRVEVIEDFAVVFQIAKRQGGQMSATLERTIRQIYERIELRQELQALLAAKKMEQRIMCIMPFAILFFVGRASGGYFTPLYHNLKGVIIMSFCMCTYLFGVWWGEKLTEVAL